MRRLNEALAGRKLSDGFGVPLFLSQCPSDCLVLRCSSGTMREEEERRAAQKQGEEAPLSESSERIFGLRTPTRRSCQELAESLGELRRQMQLKKALTLPALPFFSLEVQEHNAWLYWESRWVHLESRHMCYFSRRG